MDVDMAKLYRWITVKQEVDQREKKINKTAMTDIEARDLYIIPLMRKRWKLRGGTKKEDLEDPLNNNRNDFEHRTPIPVMMMSGNDEEARKTEEKALQGPYIHEQHQMQLAHWDYVPQFGEFRTVWLGIPVTRARQGREEGQLKGEARW